MTCVELLHVKALILDVDQTLVPFGHEEIDNKILILITDLRSRYKCCILSNAPDTQDSIKRLSSIQNQTRIKVIFTKHKKPSPAVFRDALAYLCVEPSDAAMVGDRVLVDVAGANYIGMKSVLVRPLRWTGDPFFMVTIPRLFENLVLKTILLFLKTFGIRQNRFNAFT